MEGTHLPPYLQKKIVLEQLRDTKRKLSSAGLNTVCEEARCPNISECFRERTATFMILGKRCTRACRFCSVEKGLPNENFDGEADAVVETARNLGLKYVVVTSVTRDDLDDGGANVFKRTAEAIKKLLPGGRVEILTPDFKGNEYAWNIITESNIDVFAHNVETVPELYRVVRPGADYERSLKLLNFVHKKRSDVIIKSGLMVGLGENKDEIKNVLIDLRDAGCDIVTVGQYLRPTNKSLEVKRYVKEDEYREYMDFGKEIGLKYVFAGPFIRSSYRAEYVFNEFKKLYPASFVCENR